MTFNLCNVSLPRNKINKDVPPKELENSILTPTIPSESPSMDSNQRKEKSTGVKVIRSIMVSDSLWYSTGFTPGIKTIVLFKSSCIWIGLIVIAV